MQCCNDHQGCCPKHVQVGVKESNCKKKAVHRCILLISNENEWSINEINVKYPRIEIAMHK